MKIEFLVVLAGLIFAAALFWLSTNPEPVDPYCEMVKKGVDSNGEFGWPDYRENEECE